MILVRVLMVTPSYYPIKGGAEAVVRNLSVKLNETGIHTDIMTFNMDHHWKPYWQAKVERIDGINVFRIPALNWFPLEHSDRITLGVNLIPGRFRNNLGEYDLLHFHGGDLSFPLFSCMIKKPRIFHSHGFSLDFYKRYRLSKVIFKNIADLYIAISQHMRGELYELGLRPNRIRYLPNGVDVKIFHPIGKKDENLILFVGRITSGKGLHVLLESLRYVKTEIHLVIIGPPDWDIEYFREIQKRITDKNKKGTHKITYLGAQEQTSVVKWYQKASIYVLPSFREAFPVAILEALSCRTPVVATNVGGISEVVCEGENGLLTPPNNAIKLAESINYLLDNKDVRIRFGEEGRKRVIKHFSYSVVVKRLCRIYREMLS